MFDVKPTTIQLPEKARLFDSYVCACCGESADANWVRLAGSRKLGLDCYEAYDRFDVSLEGCGFRLISCRRKNQLELIKKAERNIPPPGLYRKKTFGKIGLLKRIRRSTK